jgi:DNA polymerase I-like protein with 3'-5' exonuclease and polymerase domains
LRDDAFYKAFNSAIQGGAADIMECTQVRLADEVDSTQECRMLLQVHDAFVFEIREDVIEYYLLEIKRVMEDVNNEFDFGVPFAVDIHEWGKSA